MELPEFPVEGGCQCGAVRYRLKASPLAVYNCHCKDCQRFSGSGWSVSMPVRAADFEQLSGELASYERVADSGREISMRFCAHCHTWLWNEPPIPGIFVVRIGTLDDIDWAEPIGNIWNDSRAAWTVTDPALVNIPGQADDWQPLLDAWTKLTQKDN